MEIWLDNSNNSDHIEDDCGDCDPAGGSFLRIKWPPASSDVAFVQALTLKSAQSLYVQECGNGRWLACNPTGLGRIAVLDLQALSLLQLFRTPTTFSQVMQISLFQSLEHVEKILTLFYCLGFLQDVNMSSSFSVSEEPQILTAWLHVTNECNLRCHYCYLHKTHEDMSNDVGRRSVDAIFRSADRHNIKTVRLKYAGGEASLHMMSVMLLHDYATKIASKYDIKLEAVILSNGVSISQNAIEYLKDRQISVAISLDGLGIYNDSQRPLVGGQGSSKYILRTIDRLLASNVMPFLTVTISQRNLKGLPELMLYILKHNLPFSLNYYRENEHSACMTDLRFANEQIIAAMHSTLTVIEHNLPERSLQRSLLDKANTAVSHHRTCGVGQNYMVIDQRGGVAKCQMDINRTLATVDADDPLSIIREDRLGVQGLAVEEKEGCQTCSWRYWCTGGCPLLTYKATGRYDVKSPNCNIYKALFPAVLRLEALRLLNYKMPLDFSCI
jgi:uncharacterized protein